MTRIPVIAAVLALLCPDNGLGFGMIDLFREVRQQEIHNSKRSFLSPPSAIVKVLMDAIDDDKDGEITLFEVGSYIDSFLGTSEDFARFEHPRGPQIKMDMLFAAKVLDNDRNGAIDAAELHNAASMLVDVAGDIQVGRVVRLVTMADSEMDNYSAVNQAAEIESVFMDTTDTDSDGIIDQDELEAVPVFAWYTSDLNRLATRADSNNDNRLTQSDLPNIAGDNIVKFNIGNKKSELEVKKADLWILVRMKNDRSSPRNKRRQRAGRRRSGRKVHLKISTIKEPNSRTSRDVKGEKSEILTEVRLRVKKSQWQKFGMPLNLIQTILDDPKQSLSLKVDCTGCGRKVSPVLLYRDKRKRKSTRKGRRTPRKRKLSKKRPLLLIQTRIKSAT